MNPTLKEVIARETALLEKLVDAPEAPFGYGVDLVCVTDLREDFGEENHESQDAIGHAVLRRWITPRGQNPDDPDYGEDIRGFLNKGITTKDIREKAGKLKQEAEKDDRVGACTVTLTPSPDGRELRVSAAIVPKDPAVETFTLTFAVTSGAQVLKEIAIQ